ncbi:hypothetical protein B0H14DRAFT_2607157 [Mycena olivaceomarginata]|nr:hypothetical protein B0H14DRAFT_2607157 [Mycena olivaceomarginata]
MSPSTTSTRKCRFDCATVWDEPLSTGDTRSLPIILFYPSKVLFGSDSEGYRCCWVQDDGPEIDISCDITAPHKRCLHPIAIWYIPYRFNPLPNDRNPAVVCWCWVFSSRLPWIFMSKRRGDANENNILQFINVLGPPKKRQRRLTQPITEAMQAEAQRVWQERHQAEVATRAEFTPARECEAEAERRATSKIRVGHVLQAVKAAGYGSLYGFLDDLVTTKDQNHSSQVSQMLISHGDELLNSIHSRQPEVVSQWITKVAGNILAEEGAKLAQHLRPPHGQKFIAPTLCHFLALLAKADPSETHAEGRKDKNLVLAMVLCILSQTTNEKASKYQTIMGIYLLACGASCSQFDILNHAGICLSYRSVLRKIKIKDSAK